MSILQFAEAINKVTGNTAGIIFEENSRSARDPQRRQPDITRANEILNWSPKVNLEEGIHRTVPFFKQKLGIE
jgi:dTDP-glucose 4,6-dehydratase